MSGMPLVSVVAIFYNEERFLNDAIGSVVAQTFTDWELLLVDDGIRIDASREIARKWEVRVPKSHSPLEHPGRVNRGTGVAQSGHRMARGRWLAPLDGDDAWLPHKLETQLRLVEAHPGVGITYSFSRALVQLGPASTRIELATMCRTRVWRAAYRWTGECCCPA